MLRAFYTKFLNMKDDNSQGIRNSISKCIWKTDEFGNLKMDQLKIDSQVSTDDDKEEFMTILCIGEVKKEYYRLIVLILRRLWISCVPHHKTKVIATTITKIEAAALRTSSTISGNSWFI